VQYIDLAIYITIKIYNSGRDFGTLNIWLPLTKSIFLWGFVLKLNKFEILNIPFN